MIWTSIYYVASLVEDELHGIPYETERNDTASYETVP